MANLTLLSTVCPLPFLQAANYPHKGGAADLRLCAPSFTDPTALCCLPCPTVDYIYADSFWPAVNATNWISIGSLACCTVLLLSFLVLPVQRTSRHYLTICLVISVFFLSLSFVIPLGTRPSQCFDAITPNDMRSDLSCALSGAFLLGGGIGAVMWVFIRSLSVHLQICWKIIPGELFFYAAQFVGWGVSGIVLALALTMSGVAYRLGSTCHIGSANNVGSFWGPLLAFAILSLILQLATFAYCIRVYLAVANGPAGGSVTGNTQASGSSKSHNSNTRKSTYKRVRKVFSLQWRGMAVVVIVVATVIYLATVWLILDADNDHVMHDEAAILPWILCLVENKGNKTPCLPLTSGLAVNEATLLAVLYLLSIIGIWCLLFLGRWAMVAGWVDFFKSPLSRDNRDRDEIQSTHTVSKNEMHDDFPEPQQLHLTKGEAGLVVAPKGVRDDFYGLTAPSPTYNPFRESKESTDEIYQRLPHTAPLPLIRSPSSVTSSKSVTFNFSRPGTSQKSKDFSPSSPTPQPLPSPLPFQYSPRRQQRSDSSSSWFMTNPQYSDHIPLSPQGASRSTSRNESRTSQRPSSGMRWNAESTYAAPINSLDRPSYGMAGSLVTGPTKRPSPVARQASDPSRFGSYRG